jgi:uncharacterized alkaline shock family protein YloU
VTLVRRNSHGTITIPEPVLLQIVARAAESVDGVRVRRRRSVDVEERIVRVELKAPRATPLPQLGEAVQDAVASALRTMCDLEPARVDVVFEELA